jgi:hypothetical protein
MAGRVTVLMLQAGTPAGGPDVAAEHRAVVQAIGRAPYRDAIEVIPAQAVHRDDLSHLLLEHSPTVLHLSGRGRPGSGVLLRAEDGGLVPVTLAGLCLLVKECCPDLRLVVANCCWSDELATQLADVCGCAVGVAGEIPDSTAIAFAAEFYRAVAFGASVERATRITKAALETCGYDGHRAISLVPGNETPADQIFLVPSHLRPSPVRDVHKPDATAYVARTGKLPFAAVLSGTGESLASLTSKLASISVSDMSLSWIEIAGPEPRQLGRE